MLVVLTGGPCSGKTSLINSFRNGYLHEVTVIPEIARDFLKRLEKYEPEKLEDRSFIQNYIETEHIRNWDLYKKIDNYEKDLQKSKKFQRSVMLFDRGLHDEHAYRKYFNESIPDRLNTNCLKLNYDKVFFLPFWEEIYVNDSERKETIEQAKQLESLIKQAYTEYGYELIEVPKVSLEERYAFIAEKTYFSQT